MQAKMLALLEKTGKSYSAKSLSKVLRLNYETTRKYLRWAARDGSVTRFKQDGEFRYKV